MNKTKALIELKTAQEIAYQYFPNEPLPILEAIIWGCTGWPEFWPDKTKTPTENFRTQLKEAKEKGWQNVIEGAWPQ